MVLNDLGRKINSALASLAHKPAIDAEALDAMLKDLCRALLEADVNVKLVGALRTNIKNLVNLDELASAPVASQRRLVQRAVFDELVRLVDPNVGTAGTPSDRWQPVKGKPNVIMFVGLQGSGKTTSCTKLAYYYAKKGFKTAMVCTDTFRAGAFDQLKQNATKAKIPYYGSYTETDPVQIAVDGVARFKKDKFELIIIDTSGCHVTEAELFGEMTSIADVVQPDNIIFVMDGTIGQSAEIQARNFKNAVNVGSIVMTKMDGHAKGGGAISAVAATGSPIIFIGTGEHMQDLERFDARGFISKMMGMGDIGGLVEKLQDLKLENKDFIKHMEQGVYTMRDFREQLTNMMSLGPMSKIMSMMPGMPADLLGAGGDEMGTKRMRKMLAVMDSMTDAELDSDGQLFKDQPTRVERLARGAGSPLVEVQMLLQMHAQFAGMVKKMGGKNGWMTQMKQMQQAQQGGGLPKGMSPQQMAKMQKQMAGKMNPQLVKQMRARMAGGRGGMPSMDEMMEMMGGAGGLAGLMGGAGGGANPLAGLMGGAGGGGLAEMMKNMGGALGGLGGLAGLGGFPGMK
ncbi:Signal recognition particle [Allomyces arbusculus]|nr:Signal recognition particle [Allomyces arbusculus]